ncbi:MAG: NAD(+)/NADH kinase [Sporomusaceae bacterium]|nr:NAD(+)/NADH kinase [Sporomusaceae bacterium]
MLTLGLFPNIKKAQAEAVAERIEAYLKERSIRVVVPAEAGEIMDFPTLNCSPVGLKDVDIVLTLGGDGTFMNVARTIAPQKIPVCGVNLGKLGFLTEVELNEVEAALESLLSGQYRVEERLMLQAAVENKSGCSQAIALNDIVVTKSGYSRIIRLNLFVNDVYTATYPADGLIISTPTGATAYSLSAGGPFVEPNLNIMVITPICSHTLYSRSLIVSGDDVIRISLEETSADVVLSADGQNLFPLEGNSQVVIRRADDQARFIRFHDKSYFDILRNKLCRGDSCDS